MDAVAEEQRQAVAERYYRDESLAGQQALARRGDVLHVQVMLRGHTRPRPWYIRNSLTNKYDCHRRAQRRGNLRFVTVFCDVTDGVEWILC